ncbi:MAG: hypothetical protein ABJP33_01645 [Pseudoruegeria sp.]
MANQAGAEKAFKALGINEGDLVVLYDNYHHMHAGRIWWAMRYWEFANVRVLNGGCPPPSTFTIPHPEP